MIERNKYTAEFKRKVIVEYYSTGSSQLALETKYDIGAGCISRWLREESEKEESAFLGKGKVAPVEDRIAQLERTLAERDEELAILKKALRLISQSPRNALP